jgi:hypothetical protein
MPDQIQKILDNRPAMIAICLCVAAGAVVSIAGGFLLTYNVVTMVGAQ